MICWICIPALQYRLVIWFIFSSQEENFQDIISAVDLLKYSVHMLKTESVKVSTNMNVRNACKHLKRDDCISRCLYPPTSGRNLVSSLRSLICETQLAEAAALALIVVWLVLDPNEAFSDDYKSSVNAKRHSLLFYCWSNKACSKAGLSAAKTW